MSDPQQMSQKESRAKLAAFLADEYAALRAPVDRVLNDELRGYYALVLQSNVMTAEQFFDAYPEATNRLWSAYISSLPDTDPLAVSAVLANRESFQEGNPMHKLNMSDRTFYALVDELVKNQSRLPHGFSNQQQQALSVYAGEKMRGGDVERVFATNHEAEYAQLAGLVAMYAPGARTVSELAAQVTESDVAALHQIALQHSFHRLAEAMGSEPARKPRPDGLWSN